MKLKSLTFILFCLTLVSAYPFSLTNTCPANQFFNSYNLTSRNFTCTASGGGGGACNCTLDQAFDLGKVINGATSAANAFKVGDGTTEIGFYTQYVPAWGDTFPVMNSNKGYTIITSNNQWFGYIFLDAGGAFGVVQFNAADNSVYISATNKIYLDPDGDAILSPNNGQDNLGGTTGYFDNMYADDFVNIASNTSSIYVDPEIALARIGNIQPSFTPSDTPGYLQPDYSTMPNGISRQFKIRTWLNSTTNETLSEEVPLDYTKQKDDLTVEYHYTRSLLKNIDYLNSAVKALKARNEALETRIAQLEARIK
jgi:hypothetical protein